jgi:hypothetical protein
MIALPDAVVDPDAVVICSRNTCSTQRAMSASGRSRNLAVLAVHVWMEKLEVRCVSLPTSITRLGHVSFVGMTEKGEEVR